MWGELLGALIGLVSIALTTNLLTGWQAKARKTLREEVELLEKLPRDVRNREAFADYVSEGLRAYMNRVRDVEHDLSRLRKWRVFARLMVLGGLAVVMVTVGLALTQGLPLTQVTTWPFWVVIVGYTIAYSGTAWSVSIRKQVDRRLAEHVEQGRERDRSKAGL